MVAIIQGLAGAPGLVEWRMTDVLHPDRGDPDEAVIITGGDRTANGRAFDDSVGMEYIWQITVYNRTTPDVDVEDDSRIAFIERVQKALAVKSLSGAPLVWDFEVTPYGDWGVPSFREGIEASRFGILYRTWELQNA